MKKLLLVFLSILLAACSNQITNDNTSTLTLTYITIPKGDAFIIDVNNEYHYMLDTGKNKDFTQIDAVLKAKNIDKLDGIILSHGHKDHAGSFEEILNNYKVDNVYVSSIDNVSYKEINVKEIANKHHVNIVEVKQNDEINIADVRLKMWIPNTIDYENENNNSIIVNIIHGDINYLMMGDAEKNEELFYLNDYPNLNADLLKFGHHGEDDASTKTFITSIKPKIAIKTANINENIDSFNNKLDKYIEALNIKVYDANKDILAYDFISDSKNINIKEVK